MQIIALDPRIHGEETCELIAKTFPDHGYFDSLASCRDSYAHNANHDHSASRIGLLDGRIVAHWGVMRYQMRIGAARVKIAGIGGVTTHGEYRRQGLMDRLIRTWLRQMRHSDYDMSVLFGIPNFYHRFGYVRAWPGCTYTVQTDRLPKDKPAAAISKCRPKHCKDMERIYNRQNRRLTGTAVRPTYLKNFRPDQDARFWTDPKGNVAGYVVVATRGGQFQCLDQGGDVEQVLAVLRRLAVRSGYRSIRFLGLHHDSKLAKRLRRGDCEMTVNYQESGGAMIRTLRLAGTLGKMAGELGDRLKKSELAGWRGKLLIADRREKVILAIGRTGVRVAGAMATKHAVRGRDEIAQLLIGTDEPQEVVEAGRIRLTGDARRLVQVLFPAQHADLAMPDHF